MDATSSAFFTEEFCCFYHIIDVNKIPALFSVFKNVDGFVVLSWMQLLLHSFQKNFVMIVHYRSRVFVGPRLKVLLAGSHPFG